MREYRLADTDYRTNVDLTEYEDLIKKVLNDEAPEVKVTVLEDRYVLNKPISRGQAIRIGRRLAKSSLGEYCILRPILFVGQDTINQHKVRRSPKENRFWWISMTSKDIISLCPKKEFVPS